ncbi:MAG TPA: hypothetical protein VHZ25_06220 [Acidobacteriaceae bacterium]|jgi:hypothetical protein|nr:hypothetical protein [Acidobacteriaceae bacterium]
MGGSKTVLRWDDVPVMQTVDAAGNVGAPRRGADSDAEIVLPGRGLQYNGHIVELRAVGCVIETKCRLEPGTMVEVWLRTHGEPLRIAASLVGRQENWVRFSFPSLPVRKAAQIEDLRAALGLG